MGRKKNWRVSRIGSYAIASSIKDATCFSCTTFNILAPIYKRLSHKEFWVGSEELVSIYDKRLGDAGYNSFKLARTNNRGDGLLTALHKDYFRIISYKELLFNDFGDRVAQLLHVELIPQCRNNNVSQEILIVNTHLLFPHDSSLCLERLRQVYKILHYVESYQKDNQLNPLPILLCGDWNGSKSGHVYKFIRSLGFISSYDAAHLYTDADAHKWVSHRNHRGNICGVDFIWLLNPNGYRKLLKTTWGEALSGLLKYQLKRASLTEGDAFAFLTGDGQGKCISYFGFCQALQQLNLIGHCHGLHNEEIQELWVQADINEDGVLDYEEFKQRIWNAYEVSDEVLNSVNNSKEQTIGFSVKNAVLFPTQVEKGLWPDDYSLSDHARLTVVFSPVRMPCSRLTP